MADMKESNSRNWEEHIYWQNFQFVHFSLTLHNDFHHHLALPKKFTEYMKAMLPEQIVLKVNEVSWNVSLNKGKDEIMFQGEEWQEFVNAYSLKKADILVFKYNRRECFEVLLFDQTNLCEKEASYFVRKVEQKKTDAKCSRKRTSNSSFKGITDDNDTSSGEENPKKNSCRTPCTRDHGFDDHIIVESDKSSDEEDFVVSYKAKTTSNEVATAITREFPSNISWKRKRNVAKSTGPMKRISGVELCYRSNRREISDLEKANTLKKAMETSAHYINAFIVVMRPTCVYKRFYMTIPTEWKSRRVFRKGQEVALRTEKRTWMCRVAYNRNNAGFEGVGWKNFARDNFLEEFDVCLFVPSCSKNESHVLNVSIFRVVSETVPPSLIE